MTAHHRIDRVEFASRRRGAMYFFALFLALLVSTLLLGLSAIAASQRHTLRNVTRGSQAMLAARAGVEHVLRITREESTWRAARPNGIWLTDVALGEGSYSVTVVDDDGDLNDDPADDVVVTSTGSHEGVTQTVRVRARPVALRSLTAAISVSQELKLDYATLSADGSVHANDKIHADDSTVAADLYAVDKIELHRTTHTGAAVAPAARIELPSAGVVDLYAAQATSISRTSLPLTLLTLNQRRLEGVVLSPNNNPYGPTNARGIYLINLQGIDDLTIKNVYVVGTLIVRNPNQSIRMRGGLVMKPAYPNYPTFFIDAANRVLDIEIALQLLGSTLGGVLSLLGLGGDSNVYDSEIEGLVVATGALDLRQSLVIRGSLIQQGLRTRVQAGASLTVDHSPWIAEQPPPGFHSHRLATVPGTWRVIIP